MTVMKDSQEGQFECLHQLYKKWKLCWLELGTGSLSVSTYCVYTRAESCV